MALGAEPLFRGLRHFVNAYPVAPQALGGDAGGRASAEPIQHKVAGVGRRLDDAFKQGERLLRPPISALFA